MIILPILHTDLQNRQIAIADRIVINKKDLLKEDELKDLQEDIQSVNSVADILVTERAR